MRYDPVCGKELRGVEVVPSVEYKRRRFHFCSAKCRSVFLERAERARIRELFRVGALLSSGKVRWGMA